MATTCASLSGSATAAGSSRKSVRPSHSYGSRLLRRREQRRRREDRRERGVDGGLEHGRERAAGLACRAPRIGDYFTRAPPHAPRPVGTRGLESALSAAPRIEARPRHEEEFHAYIPPEPVRRGGRRLRRARRGAPVAAQTTLKMNISIAQNSHYGVAIDTFAREVEKRTNGRYKVQNFYSGALGAERESIEALQLGTLDLTMTSTGPVPNFVPEVAILDIPFLFRDYAHARAVLDGPIGQEMLKKFDAKGIKALAWGENGFRHMTNSKHAVNVPGRPQGPQDAHDGEPGAHRRPTRRSASSRRRWRSPRCSRRCSRARSTARRTRCR